MSIEKVLSGIEHVHAFTRAVSVGNPREFLQAEKEDQEMAEACKRLIKNCIICWNYLYLSQKLAEIDDPAKREELLQAMAHGSAAAWGHLNLLGEYDFSEDKLQDSVGIKHPKTDRLNQVPFGSSGIAENPLRPGSWQESCGTLRTFVGLTPMSVSEFGSVAPRDPRWPERGRTMERRHGFRVLCPSWRDGQQPPGRPRDQHARAAPDSELHGL